MEISALHTDEELSTLRRLIEFESTLFSFEVESIVFQLTQPQKNAFITFRRALSNRVADLKTRALKVIADETERSVMPEIKKGIANIQAQLDNVNELVAVLQIVSTFLGLLDRFIALVI
jgi:hypothetical protein